MMAMRGDPSLDMAIDPQPLVTERPKVRMWAANIPFKKSGFPSLGTFGARVGPVVIIPMAAWTQLCREIPELGARQFDVGTEE